MSEKEIGNFRIKELLGTGNFARVYLVEDKQRHQYALKVLKTAPTKNDIKMLKREARIGRRLFSCPWIAHPIDYGSHEEEHYLIMEYAKGEDLSLLLEKRGAFSIKGRNSNIVESL